MEYTVWFLVLVYLFIGSRVAVNYWDKHTEEDKKNAEIGTTSFLLMLITFLWPIKLIYDYIKKKML